MRKNECHIDGRCNTENVVYQARIEVMQKEYT